MKFKDRKEMLKHCNTVGEYIHKEYYDLNNVEDLYNYLKDCTDNYCDEFMYRSNNVDYYDEDHYISYHLKNIPENMYANEDLWKKVLKENYEIITDICASDMKYIIDYENFKDKKYAKIVHILITCEQEIHNDNWCFNHEEDQFDFNMDDFCLYVLSFHDHYYAKIYNHFRYFLIENNIIEDCNIEDCKIYNNNSWITLVEKIMLKKKLEEKLQDKGIVEKKGKI